MTNEETEKIIKDLIPNIQGLQAYQIEALSLAISAIKELEELKKQKPPLSVEEVEKIIILNIPELRKTIRRIALAIVGVREER